MKRKKRMTKTRMSKKRKKEKKMLEIGIYRRSIETKGGMS